MMKKLMILIFVTVLSQKVALADDPNLTIFEIQYTENEDGSSYYDGMRVNCAGGIVIHKYSKGRQRVILYDPNHYDGWGGIMAKGLEGTPFDDVNLGDWISLNNVIVYEEDNKARGNTTLFLDALSLVIIERKGNPLPEPLSVSISEIAAPFYDDFNDTWFVTDHSAEKYEAMYIKVTDVNIGDMYLGSHNDNYVLCDVNDPNKNCWAADYINSDKPIEDLYMPVVETGVHLCGVSGILEQYTHLIDGWDYYQLLTTKLEDFVIEQTADFDGDCDVDFFDYARFSEYWLTEDICGEPDWCGGSDLPDSRDGAVDVNDLSEFTKNWLAGTK